MGWAERKRHSYSQAAPKLAGRQDCFPGCVDLVADFGCMISKCDPGFGESGATGGSCKKLNAQFRLEPE